MVVFNWSSLFGIALWALIPGFIAAKKGRSFAAYYFLSFVLTPLFTMIITLCLNNRNDQHAEEKTVLQAKSPDSPESHWVCKCGCENSCSLTYCPVCRRTREEVEGMKE